MRRFLGKGLIAVLLIVGTAAWLLFSVAVARSLDPKYFWLAFFELLVTGVLAAAIPALMHWWRNRLLAKAGALILRVDNEPPGSALFILLLLLVFARLLALRLQNDGGLSISAFCTDWAFGGVFGFSIDYLLAKKAGMGRTTVEFRARGVLIRGGAAFNAWTRLVDYRWVSYAGLKLFFSRKLRGVKVILPMEHRALIQELLAAHRPPGGYNCERIR
jgi:hypothetical protein